MMAGCNSTVSQKMLEKQKKIYDQETESIISGGGASRIDFGLDAVDLEGGERVVVAAWKSAASAKKYYKAPGNLDTLRSGYLTWVVQASQYKTLGRKVHLDRLSGQKLALRLEQALGLPPAADTTRVFLVMEMDKSDLFRPCRDPEIEDCNCNREFPSGYYSDTTQYGPVYRSLASATKGFPWTRMGYTFDWKKSSRTHFGFSEYVIRQGAVVKILAKEPTEKWLDQLYGR
jgi:hypothetical protein